MKKTHPLKQLALAILTFVTVAPAAHAYTPVLDSGFNFTLIDVGGLMAIQDGASFSVRALFHPCYNIDESYGVCTAVGAAPLKGVDHVFAAFNGELRLVLHLPYKPWFELGGGIQHWSSVNKNAGTATATVMFPVNWDVLPALEGLLVTGSAVFVPSNKVIEGVVGARFDFSGLDTLLE